MPDQCVPSQGGGGTAPGRNGHTEWPVLEGEVGSRATCTQTSCFLYTPRPTHVGARGAPMRNFVQRGLSPERRDRVLESLLSGEKNMAKVIGIDLGTTNSCVAVMDGKDGRVIENSEG